MTRRAQAWVAELVGTYVFVALLGAAVIAAKGGLADYGLLGIATAHGVALAAIVTAFAAISGAHFNPAVTLSAWLGRRMELTDAIGYIVVQIAGAVGAAATLRFTFTETQWRPSNLATPGLSVPVGKGLLLEALFTFFLVVAVWGTGIDERGQKSGGIPVGFTVFAILLVGFPLTGAGINPARYLGPAIVSGHYTDWWVYIAGPAIGAVVGAAYPYLFMGTKLRRASAATTAAAAPTPAPAKPASRRKPAARKTTRRR